MQIKRFEAEDMAEALRQVKQELGIDAVILSARSLKKGGGIFGLKKNRVEITAAIDGDPLDGKEAHPSGMGNVAFRYAPYAADRVKNQPRASGKNTPVIHPMVKILGHRMEDQGMDAEIASGLLEKLHRKLLQGETAEAEDVRRSLARILEESKIRFRPIRLERDKQKIVVCVGPTGVGKTTTVAKLAAVIALRHRIPTGLISLDGNRIAGDALLKTYARIMEIHMEAVSDAAGLDAALRRMAGFELIMVDTPGINPKDRQGMGELKSLLDRIPALETHLLMSSTTKDSDMEDIVDGFGMIPIRRLLFTKIDETGSCGNILNRLIRTGIPASYFTTGPRVPEHIEAAAADRISEMLLGGKPKRRSWPLRFTPFRGRQDDEPSVDIRLDGILEEEPLAITSFGA